MAKRRTTRPGEIYGACRDQDGPETARVYERAHPANESGMGRLDNNKGVPESSVDGMEQAVTHRQPSRQINADDVVDNRASRAAAGVNIRDDGSKRPDGADIVNQ
jgi:hypothetical protein